MPEFVDPFWGDDMKMNAFWDFKKHKVIVVLAKNREDATKMLGKRGRATVEWLGTTNSKKMEIKIETNRPDVNMLT